MHRRTIPSVIATTLLFAAPLPSALSADDPERVDLFGAQTYGYDAYRIPSLIVTGAGTVLAFCEGRRHSARDAGDIDLLLRRSTDGGHVFDAPQTVWDERENTCGNPCPVVDRDTGTIWLLVTHNLGADTEEAITKGTAKGTRTVWLTRSTDDGRTWAPPADITAMVKKPDWTWYATGPGAGIQLRSGRLVIPCDHRSTGDFSHVIYSDDHGATWQIGGVAGPGCNECEVVEQSDGALLLNMRNYNPARSCRAIALSHDQGQTWSATRLSATLIEPTCQASLRRFSWAKAEGKSRLLFSNPASQTARENLTVRVSYDEGETWPENKVIDAGPAAYSCLSVLPDRTILCLYENGQKNAYEKISLARFTLEWVTEGRDR
jgi:sialidase-1